MDEIVAEGNGIALALVSPISIRRDREKVCAGPSVFRAFGSHLAKLIKSMTFSDAPWCLRCQERGKGVITGDALENRAK